MTKTTITFRVTGVNLLTNNEWVVRDGLATRAEAQAVRRGFARLEAEGNIGYLIVAVEA